MAQPTLVKSLHIILISLQILTLPTAKAEWEICVFDYMGINVISEKGISLWYTAFNLSFCFLLSFQTSVHDFLTFPYTRVWILWISWEIREDFPWKSKCGEHIKKGESKWI